MNKVADPILSNILANLVPFLVEARTALVAGGWKTDEAATCMQAWMVAYIGFQAAQVQAAGGIDSSVVSAEGSMGSAAISRK